MIKHHINIRILLILFVVVFSMTGCQDSRPSDVLPPDKMEAFLYDFHIAKSLGDDAEYSERYNRSLYVDYVYDKHHVTKEEFDHSMEWYSRNLTELVKIYDRINARMGTEKEEIDQLVAWQYDTPMVSVSGDSVDIWAWHQIYRLTGTPLNNTVSFVLPVDSNFYSGDRLEWNVRFSYQDTLRVDSTNTAFMQLALYFENDSLRVKTQPILRGGMNSLTMESDTTWNIKNVKGFIYYPPQKVEQRLLIDSISLYRYHLPKDTTTVSESDIQLVEDSVALGEVAKDTLMSLTESNDVKELEQPPH